MKGEAGHARCRGRRRRYDAIESAGPIRHAWHDGPPHRQGALMSVDTLKAFLASMFLLAAPSPWVSAARAAGEPPGDAPVTFTKDVAPVLYAHCVSCHRPGEVAPFSLRTYDEVKKHARQIANVTGDRVMPPWKAEQGADVFHDARRLSDAEI